jgi:hypothetical protein
MKVSKVRIENILGIQELEFEAGAFNEISGRNGEGKTSALEAIKSVFAGGHDATLLRNGAEKGEIVLVLDDGTDIKKKVTEKGQTTVVERDGVRQPNPATTIKMLTDLLSVNPLEFLRAPAKKRVDVLLDSLPMTASAERLAEILGRQIDVKASSHALETIALLHKEIFDDRTGTNRAVREKESTINQLAATLPDGPAGTPAGDAAPLLDHLASLDSARDTQLGRISTKLDSMRETLNLEVEGIRALSQQRIEALRQQIEDETASAAEKIAVEKTAFGDAGRRAAEAREKAIAKHAEDRQGIASQLASIQASQSQAAKHEQTRATIKSMRAEADSLVDDAERQSSALAGLEAYKSELLASLPISGLEVRDGSIFRHGVIFDRLNTAQQVEIAIEIAKKRASELGVICVDGLELLDSRHFAEFKKQVMSSGLQLFVTRVTDGDFEVSSVS